MIILSKRKTKETVNDDSFVSYTEMRLDQLYRESQNLNKQIKFLEEKCLNERDLEKIGIHQELRNKKMFDLEQKSKYSCFSFFYNDYFVFLEILFKPCIENSKRNFNFNFTSMNYFKNIAIVQFLFNFELFKKIYLIFTIFMLGL